MLRIAIKSCPPLQVTILSRSLCTWRQEARGWSATFRQATGSATSPPRSRARSAHPLLQSPCTAPIAPSPPPGLTYCRRCFKEVSETTSYLSFHLGQAPWLLAGWCWGQRRHCSFSCHQTFPQISAMCPGSDQSILKKQAQQSPDDPLKTTSKVQQDIQEGESLTVF